MLLLIIRVLYVCVCTGALATYTLSTHTGAPKVVTEHPVGSFLLMLIIALSILLLDLLIPRKRVEVISAIYFGLLIGVLLAYLMNLATQPLFAMQELFGAEGEAFRGGATLLSLMILPYLCITFLLQTKDQFRFVIPYVEFARELKGGRPMILDSSALIDGRIADVVDTNVIDAQFVVPQFILQEVQDIADSHDKVRRSRGRRGLDVLRRLQQDPKVDIKVHDDDTSKGMSVDQRLIEIAKQLNGRIVTNDLNLNKLAGVQGIDVINLNDVSNSLKPRFIPGEHVRLKIIKEGEGPGQGVGYLDDGTMVVVDQGIREIGKEVDTVVTSVLQNSAGRMIFCRLAAEVK
ncbi:putative PIN and TRAM-domain containing protein precursor [Maioricimonas rarisocia]|uniref:Putative PIN and TRAM-domain containing protein n=1 Tax=Maioricimonas rarisocia TaxID=2528026 RepID=A0A517ZDW7_9PLAN|nr:PIN domain-containing protein [Maioricimonas rarisocia]QDU40686.1 putative PIN and TRAM-domain containing protein precursor [Maioricimonas rarisocia]